MMKALWLALAPMLYLAGLAGAAAAPAQTVTGQDPQAVRALFDRWGFHPEAIYTNGSVPSVDIVVDDTPTSVAFGGCTNGRRCTYFALITSFSDIVNPPFEWLNDINGEFDNVTVTRREDGHLGLRMSVMLGTDGVPETTLRAVFNDWVAANGDIAQRAITAHLVTPAPAAPPR
jgi:hypothetical protein